ncbi:MAG TPA: peptidase S10 [Verrucomicrobiae bacterium]|nr:peptidase S10 [Verrucomicrobiae bacterium]
MKYHIIYILLCAVAAQAGKADAPVRPLPKPVVTHHAMKVEGRTLSYTATAGFLPLEKQDGKRAARIFYVAYTKDDVRNVADRPITFAFNGGPGASSIWLHLGALGPKRVDLPGNGTELPEALRLVDNDQTWLDFTDLVFIDPIGAGYSRAAKGVDPKQFYALAKDIDVAARFIRRYATQYERWLSPKFIAGESYGTTRAAALANRLQNENGMDLAGVVLLSSALNFETFSCDYGNDIAYALALPSCSSVAKYHKKTEADLTNVEKWALSDYLEALARGDTLSPDERDRIAHVVASMTGLSTAYIEASRLRVSPARFTKELLRNERRTLGLMDGRVVGVDVTPLGEYPRFDPSFFLVTGPFVEAANDYLRRDLEFQTEVPYVFLSREVNAAWKWSAHGQGYANTADDLAEAMTRNAHFRVFAAAGLYDLTTPYLSQRYTFDHLGLDPSRRGNLIFKTYPSGHQIYTDPASRKKLHDDVASFVSGTLAQRSANFSARPAATTP